MSEDQVAAHLREIFTAFDGDPVLRRLRVRLRDLGPNANDEVEQFRLLQHACRESPELAKAIESAALGDVSRMNPRKVDAQTGALVQGFNALVEDLWEPH